MEKEWDEVLFLCLRGYEGKDNILGSDFGVGDKRGQLTCNRMRYTIGIEQFGIDM